MANLDKEIKSGVESLLKDQRPKKKPMKISKDAISAIMAVGVSFFLIVILCIGFQDRPSDYRFKVETFTNGGKQYFSVSEDSLKAARLTGIELNKGCSVINNRYLFPFSVQYSMTYNFELNPGCVLTEIQLHTEIGVVKVAR